MGSGRKGALDLQDGQRGDHRRQHMATAQDVFSHGHEVCHCVIAIADDLAVLADLHECT